MKLVVISPLRNRFSAFIELIGIVFERFGFSDSVSTSTISTKDRSNKKVENYKSMEAWKRVGGWVDCWEENPSKFASNNGNCAWWSAKGFSYTWLRLQIPVLIKQNGNFNKRVELWCLGVEIIATPTLENWENEWVRMMRVVSLLSNEFGVSGESGETGKIGESGEISLSG